MRTSAAIANVPFNNSVRHAH
eukprot:COSAG06_NODE_30627_length_535_cov_1.034404_1_plen_20_part_10